MFIIRMRHEGDTKDYLCGLVENIHYTIEYHNECIHINLKCTNGLSATGLITDWFSKHPRVVTTKDLYETLISAFEKCDGVTWEFVQPCNEKHPAYYYLILWISDNGVSNKSNFVTTLTLRNDLYTPSE